MDQVYWCHSEVASSHYCGGSELVREDESSRLINKEGFG